jgi:dTDP-4-amino-4,6-dideoxygalactose transaminase
MPIPHVDVKAQYAPLVPELKAAFERTLESGRFIFGPEVEGFEREAAGYLGVGRRSVFERHRLDRLLA